MSLKKEIALVLAVKVALLYVVWELWFDEPMPRGERQSAVERAILNR